MTTTPIYITTWHREDMAGDVLYQLGTRTAPGTYEIHVWDNGSDCDMQESLYSALKGGLITSLHLDSRNTGCKLPKGAFHSMTPADCDYYVVSDGDVCPPLLDGMDWLARLRDTMDRHPNIAVLAAQLPPQSFQSPYLVMDNVVLCQAVGNTLKMVRRSMFPIDWWSATLGEYGDDGKLCQELRRRGHHVAFSRDVYCLHMGQCTKCGYTDEQWVQDPRKAGYGAPYTYEYDPITYVPINPELRM